MRILVLGGYGFIGSEIARRILAAGHEMIGIGRSVETGKRLLPDARWMAADIAEMQSPDAWREFLESVEVVVNASGALQSGLMDNVDAVHHAAIAALISACEDQGVARFVQISAVGAVPSAKTAFLQSKADGDSALRSSQLDWVIVRPGLVLGRNAYGGSALLRMIASVPFVQPISLGDQKIQTVAASDLAEVVVDAVEGRLPSRIEFDLVEEESHSLRTVVAELRAWLGVPAARVELNVPESLMYATARIADFLGYLGWRSPLRTTTLQVLSAGVVGDPETFRNVSDRRLSSLAQTLRNMPATIQERWFARLYAVMPACVAVLALFWIFSGIIALLDVDRASEMTGLGEGSGRWAVIVGAALDIGLGTSILYRPWASRACWGMVILTICYLAIGSIVRPDLWADPLGPLLKTLPVLMLCLVTAQLVAVQR